MIVIGVLNSKGGVGKSTLTAALAVRASRDNQVCVVDLDAQGTYSDWYARRGSPDNPALLTGEDRASDAVEGSGTVPRTSSCSLTGRRGRCWLQRTPSKPAD